MDLYLRSGLSAGLAIFSTLSMAEDRRHSAQCESADYASPGATDVPAFENGIFGRLLHRRAVELSCGSGWSRSLRNHKRATCAITSGKRDRKSQGIRGNARR